MPKPNARGKVALFIIAAIIFLVVGFVFGQIVKALTTLPGDKDDPVATQSYVATQLGESLATLTTRLEEVEAELAALKGSGNVTPPTGNNSGTTTPSGNNNNTNLSGNQSNTSSRTVRSNSDSLRIRKGPGTNYEIVGQMSNGDTATYLGTESGWYKIQRGSVTGYVSSQYATLQ